MHISDVHDYSPKPTGIVARFLADDRRAGLISEVKQLVDAEFDKLAEYADEHISGVAASRAQKFIEQVLRGDAEAGMALLGDASGHTRRKLYSGDGQEPWPHMINGTLFETNGITLRRQIVEANADLLRSERVMDLEAVVDGLSRQVRSLTSDLHRCREGI